VEIRCAILIVGVQYLFVKILPAPGLHLMPTNAFASKPAPHFIEGQVYSRRADIHGPYGGNKQSGISPSNVADAVFVFSGDDGEKFGYHDRFDVDANGDEVFLYTGEGQVGDMTFTRGNRAIVEHAKMGRALHLFRILGKGKNQRYMGEFLYADHEISDGSDRNGNNRKRIIFHLVRVSIAEQWEARDNSLELDQVAPNSLAEARKLAIAAASAGGAIVAQSGSRALYGRSKLVKDYVLRRAEGICECCAKPAPFSRKDGSPYLEPHHTTRLSDGGADHPRFVGAICPACHREIHYGLEGEQKNAVLKVRLEKLEPKA
jgi:5-methylcytosine-specific restriction protein A